MVKAYYGSRISENIAETPEGYLICRNVPIARVGVQEYFGYEFGRQDDGNGNHFGSNGGIDYDDALYKTSTNGTHSHSITILNTGNSQPFTIQPEYLSLYFWQRTA